MGSEVVHCNLSTIAARLGRPWRALTLSTQFILQRPRCICHPRGVQEIFRYPESRPNDAPLGRCSYLDSGSSGKFLCGSKNSFHLVMRCSCRFCTFPEGDESQTADTGFSNLARGRRETTFHSSLVSRSSGALSLAPISGHPVCHVAGALKPRICRRVEARARSCVANRAPAA